MSRGRAGRAAAALLAGALLSGSAAAADLCTLEVVGAVPAGEDAASGATLRDAALTAALREAVERVALELLGATPGEVRLPPSLLESPTEYAVRYRLREDRGERRALLVSRPGVETEYVVLVEAQVDADRVRRRLREAGLLGSAAQGAGRLRVTVEGVDSWPRYESVRRLLEAAVGEGISPQEFRPGVVSWTVASEAGPERLRARLRAEARAAGVDLRVLGTDAEGVRLRVR